MPEVEPVTMAILAAVMAASLKLYVDIALQHKAPDLPSPVSKAL
jgi:hypothetical protein